MLDFKKIAQTIVYSIGVCLSFEAAANTPYIAFSDLISGPSQGLGDEKGSGVVVTLWAQNAEADNQKLFFEDSKGVIHTPHIYYWKRADGELPSGPSNLYQSHGMTEIAFSIPNSPSGKAQIFISVNDTQSNRVPFLVRPGKIFHVKEDGSSYNDGTWGDPWSSPQDAVNKAPSGSTIYLHDVDAGSFSDPQPRAIYWNNSSAESDLNSQFSIVAYPGYQPKIIAQKAIENYRTSGMVVSKLDVYASNYLKVDIHGQPVGDVIQSSPGDTYGIQTSKQGRIISNRIGDLPGGCASKWNAAINGNKNRVDGVKIFGNEIYDYGCNGTSKLHHTTYLSVRSGTNLVVEAWEWGYNYLHGNKAKFGIHNYDEGNACGDLSGVLRIHNNVIIDQGGAGISVGSKCNWSMDAIIENNVLINVGLAADWDGVDPKSSKDPENGGIALRDNGALGLTGNYYVRNNLIYRYTEDGQLDGGKGCLNFNGGGDNITVFWDNNVCFSDYDLPFVGAGYNAINKLDNVSGSNNFWYYSGNKVKKALLPPWSLNSSSSNPMILISGARVNVMKSSPLLGALDNSIRESPISDAFKSKIVDIYGNPIRLRSAIGPVGSSVSFPNPPKGIRVQ